MALGSSKAWARNSLRAKRPLASAAKSKPGEQLRTSDSTGLPPHSRSALPPEPSAPAVAPSEGDASSHRDFIRLTCLKLALLLHPRRESDTHRLQHLCSRANEREERPHETSPAAYRHG